MKFDKLCCLTYIDENSQSRPKQFRRNIIKFRKGNADLLQFEIGRTLRTRPCDTAESFAKYFQYVHSSFCSGTFFFRLLNQRVEVLVSSAITNTDVQNGLRRSKSVGFGVIPNLLHTFLLEILNVSSAIFLILAYLMVFSLNCGSKKQFFYIKKLQNLSFW